MGWDALCRALRCDAVFFMYMYVNIHMYKNGGRRWWRRAGVNRISETSSCILIYTGH